MRLNLRGAVSRCVVAVGVAVAFATSAPAQGNIRSLTFYTVKPDRVGDFQAAIKEFNAIMVKGGSTEYYSVWVSLTGPRTFVRESSSSKWAEFDEGTDPKMKEQAADLTRISIRIGECTESSHRIIEVMHPELSLAGSGTIPKLVRVLVTQVRPEKFDDYIALMKSDIVPGIKKSGAKDYDVATGRFGESNLTITSVLGFNNWADLDEGIGGEKSLGKEGYQTLLGKVRPLIVDSQFDIYRFQPALSYLPAAAAK